VTWPRGREALAAAGRPDDAHPFTETELELHTAQCDGLELAVAVDVEQTGRIEGKRRARRVT
jgi:hypothetical protein